MKIRCTMMMTVAATLAIAAGATAQSVVEGPVYNPATNSRYYVVQAPTWAACQTFAQSMGSNLATVETAAENQWIFDNLSQGGTRKLWIGLNDVAVEGTFRWADGSTSAYRNWEAGEPGSDDYVVIQGNQKWFTRPANFTTFAVVEVSGPIHVPRELDFAAGTAALGQGMGTDLMIVGPGNHVAADGASLTAVGRTVTIRGSGAGTTTFTSTSTSSALLVNANLNVEGIRFVRETAGNLLSCGSGFISVRDCVFTGPLARGVNVGSDAYVTIESSEFRDLDSGIGLASDEGSCVAVSCLFTGLDVAVQAGSTLEMAFVGVNCTFADIGAAGQYPFNGSSLNVRLHNSIVWSVNLPLSDGTLLASHCNIQGGHPGEGNISVYPEFIGTGDYRLLPGSPCIDAGDSRVFPLTFGDLLGNPRVVDMRFVANAGQGGRGIDMGCYEMEDPNACRADFNLDGFVNSADFFDFLSTFFTCQ